MNLRCWIFGHALSAPVALAPHVLGVKCNECDWQSPGIDVTPRPVAARWDRAHSYWSTPRGQAWLNGDRSAA
jgi:hypothetical protein